MRIYGPYENATNNNRKHIVIIHDDGRRQTKSYPKYLLEQKIGRELVGDETCDHIDEDFTNDDPSNLQILTRLDNIKKHALLSNGPEIYRFFCPVCGSYAEKQMRNVKSNINKCRDGPFCSRSCAGKNTFLHYEEINDITPETHYKIQQMTDNGMSEEYIAEELQITRATVRKYK
jgi:hypothetical protein